MMDSSQERSLSAHVGSKIKFYRKLAGMSQDQLADAVHKSKSTLSKYENGLIAIDVDSLCDIAVALKVDVTQFVDWPIITQTHAAASHVNPFGSKDVVYMYYYDGRTKRIVKTYLEMQFSHAEGNEIPCRCYMDVPSFAEHEYAKYFYTGVMTNFELVSYVTLNNQSNPMEQIGLCILNPFHHNRDTWGFMFGISYNPITPFALKFLLSANQLPNSQLQVEDLVLTKSELKMIKNLNMMLLNTQEP